MSYPQYDLFFKFILFILIGYRLRFGYTLSSLSIGYVLFSRGLPGGGRREIGIKLLISNRFPSSG